MDVMRFPQAQRLIDRVIAEIFNEGRLETADVFFAPNYINHGGLIPDLVHGPEAIKVAAALFRRAFPTLYIAVLGTRMDGDMIWVRWIARGARPAERAVCPPTEARDGLVGMTRCRVIESRIVESWTDWDQEAAMRRLGLGASGADMPGGPRR
jgi:predicted SnoaL-like aldol condensation-catalyzing enzyme